MGDILDRFFTNLIERLTGPLSLRFLFQPAVATILAIRDGLKDARAGRPPYMWTIFSDPEQRGFLLREGWKSVVKVFTVAVILDLVYQFIVFRWVYPGETLVVAFVLGFLPYLLFRGLVNRIARTRMQPKKTGG